MDGEKQKVSGSLQTTQMGCMVTVSDPGEGLVNRDLLPGTTAGPGHRTQTSEPDSCSKAFPCPSVGTSHTPVQKAVKQSHRINLLSAERQYP
jgi:hypothetical protein